MVNSIQEHHNNEEIEVLRLQNEINQWKSELDFIEQEINFYLEILNSSIVKETKASNIDPKYLLNQFKDIEISNDKIKKACKRFQPKLEEKKECEDIQCDHAFLNEHVLLRLKIENYLSKVRTTKGLTFEFLRNVI
ncbi:hypothetical protein C8P64_2088 [Christiangramia gaetbulicola]|uniref:Uncharacterized protein n=1 Tax=Christiangramia gaetbulicola TaxID=703340 RepID=A0A2T6AIB4_9FLAO|nr:hypothetical protein [Christiangramia gaetbulicola]PTX43560.1 hypothetical protein C8P64_2088 [Christiangramia gaetbulicola]